MTVQRKRLGALVIHSDALEALARFYREVIGLEPFASLGTATFLKVSDDF